MLGHQRLEIGPYAPGQVGRAGADSLHRGQTRTTDKDAEPAKQQLFRWEQRVVTRGNRRTQGLMAYWQIDCSARQHVEAGLRSRQERLRVAAARARGCQLDRERQAVESPTDLANDRGIGCGELKVRVDRPRALLKKLH